MEVVSSYFPWRKGIKKEIVKSMKNKYFRTNTFLVEFNIKTPHKTIITGETDYVK